MLTEDAQARQVGAAIPQAMKELLRTNDLVRISWIQALLADAGIESFVLDENTAAVEGGIAALQRRLMVRESEHRRALRVLDAAGEPAA